MIEIHRVTKDSSSKDEAIENYIKNLGKKFKYFY